MTIGIKRGERVSSLWNRKRPWVFSGFCLGVLLLSGTSLNAAPLLPGPADIDRIDKRNPLKEPEIPLTKPEALPRLFPTVQPPEGSKGVTLTLNKMDIQGVTVFAPAEIEALYKDYIGRVITLDVVWLIAERLTQKYREEGYFLSRAVVPEQEVKDGAITLRVIEGRIGEVKCDAPAAQHWVVKKWIDTLLSRHPIKADELESVLLQINDIAGVNLRAILEPIEASNKLGDAVVLVLEPRDNSLVTGQVVFDTNASRFSGSQEMMMKAQFSPFIGQRTTVTWMSSLPWDAVKYGGLSHEVSVFKKATVDVYGSHTQSYPEYTLKAYDIQSRSTIIGAGFSYKLIRQRQQNLTTRIAFEGRTTHSDILGEPLTRDTTRAARWGVRYEVADLLGGVSQADVILSQGLDLWGASQKGGTYVSRSKASPSFTKVEGSVSRLQSLVSKWSLLTSAAFQRASGPLFSSEQCGFGGQSFGRGYNDSEITGDHCLSGATEIRYGAINLLPSLSLVPYGFYDVGVVWNDDPNLAHEESGSSSGAGLKIISSHGFSGTIGIAFPLTRPVATPQYGNGKNPRYALSISYTF